VVKETRKVQLIVLVADLSCAACRRKGIIVIEYAKIRAGFRPDVVGFGWVNVGVVAARCRQNVAIVCGKSRLLADIDLTPVDDGSGCSVYQAVDERSGRVLKNLLDSAGKLIGRLSPIVFSMAITKTVLIPSLPSSAPAANWPTVNNRANTPSMPRRLTCDIDSSRCLKLAASAGWRSGEDPGDHRATVQGIARLYGS
jgi:hypothetical protein